MIYILYFQLTICITLKAVVNVKELFKPVVVSVDSRESKGNIVLSCEDNTASIDYRSTARKVVRHSNHKIRRDWEPSRFKNNRIMEAMQKRKFECNDQCVFVT